MNQFGLEPTSVDKAAAQMQFFDSETNMHSVLYLRGDEDYGMIQPKSD